MINDIYYNSEIVNSPNMNGEFPRSPTYFVYTLQLIRFARVCSNVSGFNNTNTYLIAKLLEQGYHYH